MKKQNEKENSNNELSFWLQPLLYKAKKSKVIICQNEKSCLGEGCVSLQTHTPNTKKKEKGKVKFPYRVSFFFPFETSRWKMTN